MDQHQFTHSPDLSSVCIKDAFWGTYLNKVKSLVVPYQWKALNDQVEGAEKSYCMHNFRVAAGMETGEHGGFVFQDSDFAKFLEAAAYVFAYNSDPEMEKAVDEAIDIVCKAQREDGYLDTYYIINGLDKRFTNLRDNHELYCFGHMLEGAIAYYEATGKDKLLLAMKRYADLIGRLFGPGPDQIKGYPGHEVAEMALVRLYRLTGEERYLNLAKFFIDQRGQSPLYFEQEAAKDAKGFRWKDTPYGYQYYQAGKPVREQTAAEGHAVRAVYLYSGMADVARETRDEGLLKATLGLWDSIVNRRMYITGGIGSSDIGEAFTFDYDLPNDTAYAETCASIGLVFLAKRLLGIHPKGEYADVMEQALYNGVISGMSLDGTRFFYVNPLEVLPEACEKNPGYHHVKPERQKWFGCACCPPNLARLVASIGTYAYGVSEQALYVHLYMGGEGKVSVGGADVLFTVDTAYPWDGRVTMRLNPNRKECSFTLALRIPAWCEHFTLSVNGQSVSPNVLDGYALLDRTWRQGDTVVLDMDMPVRLMAAHPMVRQDIGKVAVARGPIVYCLEEADNGKNLHLLRLAKEPDFKAVFHPELLGGVTAIEARGLRQKDLREGPALYRKAEEISYDEVPLRFIPYYTWANRKAGEMVVWIR